MVIAYSGERQFDMQLVDAAHERDLGGRHQVRELVVDGCPRQSQEMGLARDREVVRPIEEVERGDGVLLGIERRGEPPPSALDAKKIHQRRVLSDGLPQPVLSRS